MKRTRRILSVVLSAALAVSVLTIPSFAAGDYVTEGLVARYDGNKNTASGQDVNSTIWADLSGNGNNISVTTTEKTYFTNTGLFVGEQTKVNLPAALATLVNGEEYTVEIELGDTEAIGASFQTIMNSTNDQFALFRRVGGDVLEFKSLNNDRPKIAGAGLSSIYNSTITVVFKVGQKTAVYVNGVFAGESSANAAAAIAAGDLFIGHEEASKTYRTEYKSLRFYSKALTADQIKTNYDCDVARNGGIVKTSVSIPAISGGGTPFNVKGQAGGYALKVDVPANTSITRFVGVASPTWSHQGKGADIKLTIYEWNTDYATTVASTALKAIEVKNHGDNTNLVFNIGDIAAAETYLLHFEAIGIGSIGFWEGDASAVTGVTVSSFVNGEANTYVPRASIDLSTQTAITDEGGDDVPYVRITASGNDPHFSVGKSIDTTVAKFATIKYRAPQGSQYDSVQIYAGAPAEPCAILPLTVDGEWHTVTADVTAVQNWSGTMTSFRFDPMQGAAVPDGAYIDIEWIAFTETAPAANYDGTGAAVTVSPDDLITAASAEGANAVKSAELMGGEVPGPIDPPPPTPPTGDASVMTVAIIMLLAGAVLLVLRKRIAL